MEIPHIQHIGLGSRNIGLRFARYAEYDMFYTIKYLTISL